MGLSPDQLLLLEEYAEGLRVGGLQEERLVATMQKRVRAGRGARWARWKRGAHVFAPAAWEIINARHATAVRAARCGRWSSSRCAWRR